MAWLGCLKIVWVVKFFGIGRIPVDKGKTLAACAPPLKPA